MMFAFCLRCVAESNRLGWFCRPETKPFIQRTKKALREVYFSIASAKVQRIFETHKFFYTFFHNFLSYSDFSLYLCTRFRKAPVAKLVDAPDLGSGVLRCAGSSPVRRTTTNSIIEIPPSNLLGGISIMLSDPAGIQTQDLQNRNLTLYSAKLRSHKIMYCVS